LELSAFNVDSSDCALVARSPRRKHRGKVGSIGNAVFIDIRCRGKAPVREQRTEVRRIDGAVTVGIRSAGR
jgi:hypothetical protein